MVRSRECRKVHCSIDANSYSTMFNFAEADARGPGLAMLLPGCSQAKETVVIRGLLETTCIRQTERQLYKQWISSSYNHDTHTTLRTSVMESLQMHTYNASNSKTDVSGYYQQDHGCKIIQAVASVIALHTQLVK